MNVYLLGAGASKSFEKSKSNQKLPLANDFFKIFNQLDISNNTWVLVGAILNYVKETRGVEPLDFTNYSEDIESLHSEIQIKFLEAIKKDDFGEISKYGQAFNQLIFLFCSVINEVQNGNESEFHKRLVLQLNKDDVFITFNWDTLIDKSLKYNTNWSLKNGYYVSPKLIFSNGWTEGEDNQSNILLLKLHGSTNWLSSYIHYDHHEKEISFFHDGPPNTFYAFEKTNQPYPCYDGRYMGGYEDFTMGYYPPNLPPLQKGKKIVDGHIGVKITPRFGINPKGTSSSDGVISMPIIIPPVKNKSYEFYGDLFPKLWNKAHDVLVKADKIYILGYSFPPTDIPSNDLFKSAFMNRTKIPEIIIVNPHPDELVYKFKYEFGIPENHLKVFSDYITKDYVIPC